jgi:hypothetical protein
MRTGGSGGGATGGGSTGGGGGASGGGGTYENYWSSSSHPCPSNSGTSDGPGGAPGNGGGSGDTSVQLMLKPPRSGSPYPHVYIQFNHNYDDVYGNEPAGGKKMFSHENGIEEGSGGNGSGPEDILINDSNDPNFVSRLREICQDQMKNGKSYNFMTNNCIGWADGVWSRTYNNTHIFDPLQFWTPVSSYMP